MGSVKRLLAKIELPEREVHHSRMFIDLAENIHIHHREYRTVFSLDEYFEYVAGCNTFDYCKPDPRHLTNVIEIMQGDIKKSLMIGDSETDADSARSAGIPFVLVEDGYTEKKVSEIYHDYLVKDFVNIEEIISKYLNH